MDGVLDTLGINPGLMLIWAIAFIVLYTVLTRFIYDPLTNVLNERRNRIAKGLEDAAAAARARENAELKPKTSWLRRAAKRKRSSMKRAAAAKMSPARSKAKRVKKRRAFNTMPRTKRSPFATPNSETCAIRC